MKLFAEFMGRFYSSLSSTLLLIVFKSLNIGSNFVLLLVSNIRWNHFVYVFGWYFMQFTTYCLHVLIPQSWSYLHVQTFYCFDIYQFLPNYKYRRFVCFWSCGCSIYFFPLQFHSQFFHNNHQIHICFLSLIRLLVLHFLTTFLWQDAPLICNTYTNYYPTSAAFCYPLPQYIIPILLSLSTSSTISFFF